ncbi:MAG: elongation factor G [bacterium]|nr:elongation factor G [bacterium]
MAATNRTAQLQRLRNIGIISHIDAGKTTVTERMLYYTGRIHKLGEVHDGEAVMDWMPQERERGITITAAASTCLWENHQINVIDTPGHVDFAIEVERSLRVLDGAVAIFSAVEGVQPQSESVWNQADRYHVPRLALINKMDRLGTDYQRVLQEMRDKLGASPVLLQLPLGSEETFRGVIDLVEMRCLTWRNDDLGVTPAVDVIAAELRDQAEAAREALLDAVAEHDEALLEQHLAGNELTPERVRAAIRQATLAGACVPVLLGSGLRNKGIQPLLDAIVWYLPSPIDVPAIVGIDPRDETTVARRSETQEPVAALAFKVVIDQGRRLTYLRIYSGQLEPGVMLYNPRTQHEERVARLLRMFANKRERLAHSGAGDIVAVTGLKDTTTGDTLCDAAHPIRFEAITFPEPVISLALEPRSVAEQEKLAFALKKLCEEDPTLQTVFDEERGQTIVSGMGELHLEVLIRRLRDEFRLEVKTGNPQVVYRETVQGEAEAAEHFEREIAAKQHFAAVRLGIRPAPNGAGVSFSNLISADQQIAPEYIEAVRQGVMDAVSSGTLQGYPVVDIEVELRQMTYRQDDSSVLAFQIVAGQALRRALDMAQSILLEPVMRLEVLLPEEFIGSVIGGLQSRHGIVEGVEPRGRMQAVIALAPLAAIFGYSTDLRSSSQGRGTFTMRFSHYAPAA